MTHVQWDHSFGFITNGGDSLVLAKFIIGSISFGKNPFPIGHENHNESNTFFVRCLSEKRIT